MTSPHDVPRLSLLRHPYRRLRPLTGGRVQLRAEGRGPGSALVWCMRGPPLPAELDFVERRPGGVALLVVLPAAEDLSLNPAMMELVQRCRPHALLPHHDRPSVDDLTQVLRQPPSDLAADVTDYLAWRGIRVDRDTVHLLRRTIELSAELRSITALSRSLYLSRRALGRRFTARGLPVPSHWLHFARLLRVSLKLQNSEDSVFSIAYAFGYPDGFSVSNQMQRLIGHRPSTVRDHLGWEWLVEAWLRKEAEAGGLAPVTAERVLEPGTGPDRAAAAPARIRPRHQPGAPAAERAGERKAG